MKKTLAQFKKDMQTGTVIEYVKLEQRIYAGGVELQKEFTSLPVPEKMQGHRYISHVQSNGFYLKRADDKSIKGSFCDFPKAPQLEYIDDTFTITEVTASGEPWQRRTYKVINFK